ncbi:nucleoid occlusion factor SlmA [bacterium BMS3Bbin12]|nr:nucleoid occlusion factor SlmA [bacterium BMS3Abin12]GBE48909.1 nucleoid occlusion factor SlmA [bacterium BMS3Bbin12]GBE49813.1 nucleoid occlusion factor SlmA [bacterium BMS3Bbin13]HDJ85575.1 TetR/AcrR family transcriptional regulator [Chromatiales bacterium]HDK03785.1 TetR/AcrR family transcriptional regulator [Gammaproteobacteria bacterium]
MGKRLSAGQRRATILEAAKALFAESGLHGVSVDAIAERLAVSPATLYKHFASKEALYEAVINATACSRESYVDAVLRGPSDFASVLRRIARTFVDSVAADPDFLRMEMHAVLEGNPFAGRFFENRWKHFSDYIELGIRELAPQGKAAPVDVPSASLMFQGMLREVLYVKCVYRSERYRDIPLHQLVDRCIDLFLLAIGYRERCLEGAA